jgi:uncharacterized protein involved in exopolysaccharide biosynthesis
MDVAAQQQQSLDSEELVAVLWQYRRLITVCAVLVTAVVTVMAFLMTPMFRGTVLLVPASADRSVLGGLGSSLGSVGGLAALAGINLPSKDSEIEETLAVLKSREFTQTFIVKNNLLQQLFPKKWDEATHGWKVPPAEQPTLNQAFRAFDGLRTVSRDSKTGLITLQLNWHDRLQVADLTNNMVAQVNEEMRSRAAAAADASLGYLQKELAATSDVSTREAVSRLMESQVKQRMLANVTREYALRSVDRALVPDKTDKVSPKKALMMIAGMFLGIVVGVMLALLLNTRRRLIRQHTH